MLYNSRMQLHAPRRLRHLLTTQICAELEIAQTTNHGHSYALVHARRRTKHTFQVSQRGSLRSPQAKMVGSSL